MPDRTSREALDVGNRFCFEIGFLAITDTHFGRQWAAGPGMVGTKCLRPVWQAAEKGKLPLVYMRGSEARRRICSNLRSRDREGVGPVWPISAAC